MEESKIPEDQPINAPVERSKTPDPEDEPVNSHLERSKSIASDSEDKPLVQQFSRSQTISFSYPSSKLKDSLIENVSEKFSNKIEVAYEKAVIDRKKASFYGFKQWEEKRAASLNVHRRYIEILIYRLDNRSVFGIECLDAIIRFFKERIFHEEVYAKSMTITNPKLGSLFQDLKVAEVTHGILPKIFKEFDDYHGAYGKTYMQMAEYIQTAILNDLFDSFRKDYAKKVDSFKASISDKKRRLGAANKETIEKSALYGEYFSKGMKSGQFDKSKDMYNRELGFLQIGRNQMKMETELGKETIDYMENLKRLEIQRLDFIKRGFTKYFLKMGELFGKTRINPDISIKMIEALNPTDDIEKFFNIKTFFNEDEVRFIKLQFPNVTELTMKEIKSYFQSFEYKIPPKSSLIMKEWKITKESGIFKGFRPYTIIATIDYNLLIIEEKEDMTKPEKIMKMAQISLTSENRRDQSFVEILEVTPGLIIDSKNKILLKFQNSDTAEEFSHFIRNYNNIKEANLK